MNDIVASKVSSYLLSSWYLWIFSRSFRLSSFNTSVFVFLDTELIPGASTRVGSFDTYIFLFEGMLNIFLMFIVVVVVVVVVRTRDSHIT